MHFIYTSLIISGTFCASTFTVYGLCLIKKYPFFNPHFTELQKESHYYQLFSSVPWIFTESCIFEYFLINKYIVHEEHNLGHMMMNVIIYALFIEFLYYIYHRIIHNKYLYKTIHSIHHKNIMVYPADTFYIDNIDGIGLMLCLSSPVMFIRINLLEQVIVLYTYITMGYLSHSVIVNEHHVIHHKLFNYNYSMVIPIFDILFGTYKEKMVKSEN